MEINAVQRRSFHRRPMRSHGLNLAGAMIWLSKPPFDPQAFLARVEAGNTRTELRRRQIVFSQGDPADAVFSIRKGHIELEVLSPLGKEAILATLGAGDFFGEGPIGSRLARSRPVEECCPGG